MDEVTLNKIIELAKLYNVVKLIQFGSSLESYKDCNDFDFACDGLNDKGFFKFGANLEKILKKPVDLIPLQPTGLFVEHILKHGKTLYDSTTN